MTIETQHGTTLIEVLIAVLVFSVGMLGLAGLQLTATINTHSTHLRSIATVQAYDITDRMRANIPAVNSGDYHQPTSTNTPGCLTTAGCTPSAMAQHDAFEWDSVLATSLPDGVGEVCLDSTPDDGSPGTPQCDSLGNLFAIKVWWTDDRVGTTRRFTTVFQP